MPTWSWRVRAKTMSASTWLRLVKGVLFASTVLASVAGTSSFSLVLNPPRPPSILPVLSALSTLCESSDCSFLLASTSAGEVGAAGDAPLLSISTSLCFCLMWPDFSSRENKATVIAIASWSNSNLPVRPFVTGRYKAMVLELSPTIRAILQMLERPEKEKKQAESQNSNMQSRYFLYFVYALQRAEKRPSTVWESRI